MYRLVCWALAGLGCALAASDAKADIFSMPSGQTSLAMVPIGNAGNPLDTGPLADSFGAVAYDYAIGKHEVTIGQYVQFLNAVATTDTYSLYHPSMTSNLNVRGIARSGAPGSYSYQPIGSPNRPIAFATWGSAARFTNWLTNGQPTGAQGPATTEDGSYVMNGAISNAALMAVTRKPTAQYVIPSVDEWYKAAYFDPTPGAGGGDNYWRYAMQTDTTPDSALPPGTATPNAAMTGNFFREDNINNGYNGGYALTGVVPYSTTASYLTDVGAYTSTSNYWGTFDQTGNLFEMVERILAQNARTAFGGGWAHDQVALSAALGVDPTLGRETTGFRVALVPEPTAISLLGMGGVLLLVRRSRKHAHFTPRRETNIIRAVCCVFAGLGGVLAGSEALRADIFSMPSGQTSLLMVPVGNSGNSGDSVGDHFGAVAYDYAIGKHEVTIGQYVQFLNAVAATDTHSLYNPSMTSNLNVRGIARSGAPGSYSYQPIGSPNRPIAFVTWGSAARFTNWLTNGQPTGAQGPATTEDGSYVMNGAMSNASLMAITRKATAQYVIPSVDEWHKAAYFDPTPGAGGGDNYWRYAMQTDTAPDSAPPPGTAAPNAAFTGNFFRDDQINNGYNGGYALTGVVQYSSTASYLTDVGAYTATTNYWGTFDQAGNLYEMVERVAAQNARTAYGGRWGDFEGISAGVAVSVDPTLGREYAGFRVVLVPEPSAVSVMAFGSGLLLLRRFRKSLKTP